MPILSKKSPILLGLLIAVPGGLVLFFGRQPAGIEDLGLPSSYYTLSEWGAARMRGDQCPPDADGYFRAWESKQKMLPAGAAYKTTEPWVPLGPNNFGGRTLALAIDRDDPNLVYAGSASGGLWRTRSGGLGDHAWERIETGFPVLGVGAIEIRPDNRDEIYIGTGEVYSYQNAAMGIGDRLTRGSYGIGILKSTDGGQTWQMALDWRYNQERGIQDIAFNPHNYDQVWAATTEGVYRSDDAGATWVPKLNVVMATSLVIHPQNPQILLVGCGNFFSEGHGIYRSIDGGEIWTKLTQNIPETFGGKVILDGSPSHPDTVYASIGHGSDVGEYLDTDTDTVTWLLRSEDGGASFEIVNTQDYSRFQGWYSHFVKIHPEDPDRLLVGGEAFHNSIDGGQTLSPPNFLADFHAAAFAPSDSQIAYLAFDQGISKSTDGGENWVDADHGYVTSQFYRGIAQSPSDPNLILGSPQDGGGLIYTGSMDWDCGQGSEGSYYAIDPTNTGIQYRSELFLHIGRIGLGGAAGPALGPITTWSERQRRANFIAPIILAPSNPAVLYAGADVVFRSENRAGFWSPTNGNQPLDGNPVLSLAVSHQDENLVYAGTAPRYGPMHLFRSANGGAAWVDISAGLPNRYPTSITVDPNDDSRVYVTFAGFGTRHVFTSDDRGDSWQDIDGGLLPDVPTSVLVIDPDYTDHLYVGNDLGVFVSLDRGKSWFAFGEGLPRAVLATDLLIYQPDRLLRLGSHGNGMWQRKLLEPETSGQDQVTLLYPWISNRAGDFRSVLVANNLSDGPVVATLTALRKDGTSETVTRVIEAKGFLSESASTLFPTMGSGAGYSVRLRVPTQRLYGRWVTYSLQATSGASPSQGVAVVVSKPGEAPQEGVGAELAFGYLPTSSNFLSAPVIVNAGQVATDVTLQFFDENGSLLATKELKDLGPGEPFAEVVSEIVAVGSQNVYLVARSPGTPITGVSFVFNNVFFENAIGNATAIDSASNPAVAKDLLYPWISNREATFQSMLVAVNYGDQPLTVTLTARRESGDSQTVQRDIPAHGFLAEEAASLFPQLGSGDGYAVVLQSPRSTIMGQWVTTNLNADSGASPAQGVAIAINTDSAMKGDIGRNILFGYLPITGNATSAPVLVNLGTENAAITLYFYDSEGHLLLQDQTTLTEMAPLRPFARLVNGLLPNAASDVYMVAVSENQPLAGVAFVFNNLFFEPAIGNASAVDFTP